MDEERQPCLLPEEWRGNNQPGCNQLGCNQPSRNMLQPASQAQRAKDLIDLASTNSGCHLIRLCSLTQAIVAIFRTRISQTLSLYSKKRSIFTWRNIRRGVIRLCHSRRYGEAVCCVLGSSTNWTQQVWDLLDNSRSIWTMLKPKKKLKKKRTCTKETYQAFFTQIFAWRAVKDNTNQRKVFSKSTVQTLKILQIMHRWKRQWEITYTCHLAWRLSFVTFTKSVGKLLYTVEFIYLLLAVHCHSRDGITY